MMTKINLPSLHIAKSFLIIQAILAFCLGACQAQSEEVVSTVNDRFLDGYSVSPHGAMIALVLMEEGWDSQLGAGPAQIVIMDTDNGEVLHYLPSEQDFFDEVPLQVQWVTDQTLLFLYRNSVRQWNWQTNEQAVLPIPFANMAVSHKTEQLATWVYDQAWDSGEAIAEIIIYHFPDMAVVDTFAIDMKAPMVINDIIWAQDDTSLLAIISKIGVETDIYQIDLATEKITEVATLSDSWVGDVGWNSDEEWIVLDVGKGIDLYSLSKQCFFKKYQGYFFDPIWANSALFVRELSKRIVKLEVPDIGQNLIKCS